MEEYDYKKFVLYLYLIAAYANYEVEEEEYDLIKTKLDSSQLVPAEAFEKIYKEVKSDFEQHNDYESIRHVQATQQHLNIKKEEMHKLYDDLKEIVMADHVVEESERIELFRLRKIMGLPGDEN